jgi:hypothetical protein
MEPGKEIGAGACRQNGKRLMLNLKKLTKGLQFSEREW